jgi:hypothetical protein
MGFDQMRIYLSHPITGIPNGNYEAATEAAAELRSAGHTVYCPIEMSRLWGVDGQESQDLRRKVMINDLQWICNFAEGMAIMDGWGKSTGCKAEVALAEAVGIRIWHYKYYLEIGNG